MEFRLILASDDGHHLDFLPLISAAWRRFFDCAISLVIVGNREHSEYEERALPYVDTLHSLPLLDGYTRMVCSKMARLWLAGEFCEDVVSFEDMDLVPLQRQWRAVKFEQRQPGQLMIVGEEVYSYMAHEAGKAPMSTLTSESSILKEVVNPYNEPFEAFVKRYSGTHLLDTREDCAAHDSHFSDESLFRMMRQRWNREERVLHVRRNYDTFNDTIDRSKWVYDLNRLMDGGYIESHMHKPLHQYRNELRPIARYIGDEGLIDHDLRFQ